MKKLLLSLCFGALLASCKKQEIVQQPKLTISAVVIDSLLEPGDFKRVGVVDITLDAPGPQEISFAFNAVILGNVYASNLRATLTDARGNEQNLGSIPGELPITFQTPRLLIEPGVQYKLSLYVDTEPGDMGTIQLEVRALDVPSVSLPRIRFGAPAPTVEYVHMDGTIAVGQQQVVYAHKQAVPRGTTMYQQQLTYPIRFQTADTAIGFSELRLFKNGEDITDRVNFFDEQDTGRITVFRRSMGLVRVTFTGGTGEDTLRSTTLYELAIVPTSTNPFAVELASDASWNPAHKYRVGLPGTSAKLASARGAQTGLRYNFIYSYGASNHSSVVPFSTDDHRSGYGVFASLPQRVWTQ